MKWHLIVPALVASAIASAPAVASASVQPGEMIVYDAGEAVPQSELTDLGTPEEVCPCATTVSGDPRISQRTDYQSGAVTAGVFQATRGKVRIHFPFTEHATVLAGELRLTDAWGNRATLHAGDSYLITQGTDIVWEVRAARVQKSFINQIEAGESPTPMTVYDAGEAVPQSELTDLGTPEEVCPCATTVSGDPRISQRTDYQSGAVTAGVFQATPGDIQIEFPYTEHATVLGGGLTLTDATGRRHGFNVGDSYLIRQASDIFWQVHESNLQKSFLNVVEG